MSSDDLASEMVATDGAARTYSSGVTAARWAELVEAARPRLDKHWPASEVDEYEQLTARMSDLLTQTAAALKGPPAPLSMHDWSDLPVVAARIVAERDAALAELAALRADR